MNAENRFGKLILHLERDYRKRLLDIEKERVLSKLDEEEFTLSILQRSSLQIISKPKKSHANDGGVDFAVSIMGCILVIQLKWWNKQVSNKSIKGIFGELYLSDLAIAAREKEEDVMYALITPFIAKKAEINAARFSKHGFYVVWGEGFIKFISNPYYFLTHNLEVPNDAQ